jgi:hypothetical protein
MDPSTLTFIAYNPILPKTNCGSGDRHCAKDVSKSTDEPQTTSSNLPVDMPQTRPTASTRVSSSQSSSVSRDEDSGSTGE